MPDLPGGKRPHLADWLEAVHQAVQTSSKPLVFVGHSLGTRALLLYLEKYRPQVEAAFLVAAFNNEVYNAGRYDGKTYPDFFEHKIDLSIIKPLVRKFVVIHSTDDTSIPYSQGMEIAHDLHAELITYTDSDHFSDPKNAEVVFAELQRVLQF